jgi:hypothetical protein
MDANALHPENVELPSSVTVIAFIFAEVNAVQPENTLFPKVETTPGIVIDVRLAHDLNAYSPIDTTDEGIVIALNKLLLNAYWPMVVTVVGRTIGVATVLSANAYAPIVVRLGGRVND